MISPTNARLVMADSKLITRLDIFTHIGHEFLISLCWDKTSDYLIRDFETEFERSCKNKISVRVYFIQTEKIDQQKGKKTKKEKLVVVIGIIIFLVDVTVVINHFEVARTGFSNLWRFKSE